MLTRLLEPLTSPSSSCRLIVRATDGQEPAVVGQGDPPESIQCRRAYFITHTSAGPRALSIILKAVTIMMVLAIVKLAVE